MKRINRRKFISSSLSIGGAGYIGLSSGCDSAGTAGSNPITYRLSGGKFFQEKAELPVLAEADIVVAGGGPGGLGAACVAGRMGVDVLLLERYGFLGGMATAGLVNPFMPYSTAGIQLAKGIFQETLDRMATRDGFNIENRAFDPEVFKITADEMVADTGVKLLFHSFVSGAVVENGRIAGLVVESKSGRAVVKAKLVVDATGDADVSFLAGAPTKKGRDEDGFSQPMTLNFNVLDVDTKRVPDKQTLNQMYVKAKETGEIDDPRENLLWFWTVHPGEIHFNTTRVVMRDATDVKDMTWAEVEGRRQAWEILAWLKRRVPAFKKSYLAVSGAQIGVRESRRIVGEYVMTEDDILKTPDFPDAVACSNYPIDVHNPSGTGTYLVYLDEGEYYRIPYRSLLPLEIDNLIIAGRPISTTHVAHSATRIMPTCMTIGQAAGAGAVLALQGDGSPRNVDTDQLRATLRDQGAFLG